MSRPEQPRGRARYWSRSIALIGLCLLVWLIVTILPLVMAQFQMPGYILGWPAVFALSAFGVPLVYLAIIGVFSFKMDQLEASSDLPREEEPEP